MSGAPTNPAARPTRGAKLRQYIQHHREDLATYVVHWTKESCEPNKTALERLQCILTDGRIKAHARAIWNSVPVVSFSETPLAIMRAAFQGAGFDRAGGRFSNEAIWDFIKYRPYGLLFSKWVAYHRFGARPVLYVPDADRRQIKESLWWRVSTIEALGSEWPTDWMHEREWRCRSEARFMELTQSERPVLIVYDSMEKEQLSRSLGYTDASLPWRVIALSDDI